MVLTGSKRSVLGTLKPMHFSFVTLLMIFDEFDHLHLPQPRGRHGKVGTQNPIFRQNIIISKTIFSQKKGLFGHLKAGLWRSPSPGDLRRSPRRGESHFLPESERRTFWLAGVLRRALRRSPGISRYTIIFSCKNHCFL